MNILESMMGVLELSGVGDGLPIIPPTCHLSLLPGNVYTRKKGKFSFLFSLAL